ncbi:DUF5013 domain-containing protein [Niastella caeni]|uniref:DUF5013 domain-containing protein n=1 Tax=Niastella caeni TaxID=2569763 RepID=A0A4S8HCF7_9BACT|nr:DUF4998 domain-containing protein [Niastella caeni]THU31094.1 DUF5013 domain-containing protein [Niastella caeni]
MKTVKYLTILLSTIAVLGACRKMDDYKDKYLDGGSITYAGKIDSVKAHPGDGRIMLSGLLIADPKITELRIYWNNYADSFSLPITRTPNVDTVRAILNKMEEGVKTFTMTTFDKYGNRSVNVTITGRIYGNTYKSLLLNRTIKDGLNIADSVTLNWNVLDASTGALGCELQYTDNNSMLQTIFVKRTDTRTVLKNYKLGSKFNYRTLFLPDTLAIDTFYSKFQEVAVKTDVTPLYIVNAGPGFANSAGGTARWQTPANWITTADVRNAGSDIGGLDNGNWLPSKALSIEAGWGLPAVPNGKVYQTFTLPAGKYSLIVTAGDCSTGGTKYITVAKGTTLPDIGNVPADALVYKTIVKNSDNTLDFTLTDASPVALGLQAGMTADGNFMKAFKVRLMRLP